MASIQQPFMLSRHMSSENEDLSQYPEPPPYGGYSSAPMDIGLPADAFNFPRSVQDAFPTSMAYEANSLFAEASNYMFNGRSSPYLDEGEMRPPSNLSTASAPSASSSAVGSPQSHHGQLSAIPEWAPQGLNISPGIVGQNDYYATGTEYSFAPAGMEEFAFADFTNTKPPGFVDPSLIHPMAMGYEGNAFQQPPSLNSPSISVSGSPQPFGRNGSQSPYLHNGTFQQPYSPFAPPAESSTRRQSVVSFPSNYGENTYNSGDESKEKQRCPHPDCGKVFKDLKAHMLTHQNERPEKCPILTCEYHTKGFARKYDKNRHTLTHYKGTMVCGFCPGSGSAAEKSFNRADVFKRHLTAVHGVEQTAPNSRKKAPGTISGKKLPGYPPDATGKCSTCSATFSNAQDFYEHLDDCVLRIVQQEDPAEAINAQLLGEMEDDKNVHQTMEKNRLPLTTQTASLEEDDEDEDMDEDDADEEYRKYKSGASPTKRRSNPPNGVQKSKGMTHSRGGVQLQAKKGRKHRRDYPTSWGFNKGQMTMKKRVMVVFDGTRRLAKDDMMLSTENEVRVKLSDGKSYVTDLDVQTMKRAEGFHGATEEEKGPWLSDDPTEEQMRQMQELAARDETSGA